MCTARTWIEETNKQIGSYIVCKEHSDFHLCKFSLTYALPYKFYVGSSGMEWLID
jgi:hypothetical protein